MNPHTEASDGLLIHGSGNDDLIRGDDRDDVIAGRAGLDTIQGGAGSDTIVYDATSFGSAPDALVDWDVSEDSFLLDAQDFDVDGGLSFVNSLAADLPTGGANVIVLQDADDDGLSSTTFNARSAAQLIGAQVEDEGAGFFVYFNSALAVNRLVHSEDLSDGNAALTVLGAVESTVGAAAIAELTEYTADNFAFNGEVFEGSDAAEEFDGAGGDDLLFGLGGDDNLFGAGGNDTLDGGNNNDTLSGNEGDDVLSGGNGFDELNGDDGNDSLSGEGSGDLLVAGDGNDRAVGGAGNDVVLGEDGNDQLFGNGNNDVLDGGAGNDTMVGGTDFDVIISGSGSDVIRHRVGDGTDRIEDFSDGFDRLDLADFGFASFDDVQALARDRAFGLEIDFGNGDILRFVDFTFAEFTADDVIL